MTNLGSRITTWIMKSPPYVRYQIPFFGNTFKAIDQYADAQKMYADYTRNVGKQIKYPSIRDPRSTTNNIANSFFSGVNGISGAGRTVRRLI